jgi:hypothetical protein
MTYAKSNRHEATRREALTMITAAALTGVESAKAQAGETNPAQPVSDRPSLALVSRHLQWTSADHGIEVAKKAGFNSIIWTVRKGAHVDVTQAKTELPRIVNLSRRAGISTPMLITNIVDRRAKRTPLAG